MDVLVIGGTGPSGPLIVNGLFERGHRVTVLHTGRHEVDALPPMSAVPHIHCDPFDEASFRDGLGERTFDVVFAMYGRLRMIVDVLVGRTPRLFSIGGIPVYKGFADAAAATPSGMKVLSRESDAGVGDDWIITSQGPTGGLKAEPGTAVPVIEPSVVGAVLVPVPVPPASFTGTSDEQAARKAAAAKADKIERRISYIPLCPSVDFKAIHRPTPDLGRRTARNRKFRAKSWYSKAKIA